MILLPISHAPEQDYTCSAAEVRYDAELWGGLLTPLASIQPETIGSR